jgi:hypothetical protein
MPESKFNKHAFIKPINTDQILKILKEICEKVFGEQFDRDFKDYFDSDEHEIMWETDIILNDRNKKMTLEQLQHLAHLGPVHFSTQSDIFDDEDGWCNLYEGESFKTPGSYGVYKMSGEEDVAYIGDDVYNAQCLIHNVLGSMSPDFEIDSFAITKTIKGASIYLTIYWSHGTWIFFSFRQTSKYCSQIIKIFHQYGFIVKHQEVDTESEETYIEFCPSVEKEIIP